MDAESGSDDWATQILLHTEAQVIVEQQRASTAPETGSAIRVAADQTPVLLRELTIGTIVNDKYRIEAILGSGAMGVVAKCEHIELQEPVALKFLATRSDLSNEDCRSRFRREAQVSAKLRNEHITRVVDVGVWRNSVPYMVMEYLDGVDLRAKLTACRRLPPTLAIEYTIQVCEGVAEAHALNIVHRDLKPSNLFVTKRTDGSELIKILDFGISKWNAREDHVNELTATGVILGSPKYMSPEQIFSEPTIDARADVWSVGAILYEMLVDHPPFDFSSFGRICNELANDRPPQSIRAQVPQVSEALERAIFRCFGRSPSARPQNVAELAGELLAASGSPMADRVRARIEATLGRHSGRDPVSDGGVLQFVPSGDVPGPNATLPPRTGAPSETATALSTEADVAPRSRTGKVTMAIAGLAAIALFGVLFARSQSTRDPQPARSDTPAATSPETHTVAPPAPVLPAAPPPASAQASPVADRTVVTAPQPHGAHVEAPRPRVTSPVKALPVTPSAPPSGASISTHASCDPPYTLSSDGIKSYKLECLSGAH